MEIIYLPTHQPLGSHELPVDLKEVIVGVSSMPISPRQQSILLRHIPHELIRQGKSAVFDVSDASDDWSIDYLQKIGLPRISYVRGDIFLNIKDDGRLFDRVLSDGFTIRMPVKDLWEFSLDAPEYFQYSVLATDICNLNCIMCPFHSESPDWAFQKLRLPGIGTTHLDADILSLFLESAPSGKTVRLGGNGEPFLHPHIFELIKRIKDRGLEIYIHTNGTKLDTETLKKLAALKVDYFNFGIDGITPESYASSRVNGRLETVVAALKKCVLLREQGEANWSITINYIKLPHYHFTQEEVCKFFKGMADRINFTLACVDPYTTHTYTAHTLPPEEKARIDQLPAYCFEILHNPVLGPSGLVFPCAVTGILEWFKKMPWLKSMADNDLPSIMAIYKQMLQDESSDLRKICDRCTFWAHSYRKKGTMADVMIQVVDI
ncbi:MAG: radical SAM protein [Deltaproteobacteria bacterium]|nr:radical SAM protein [Deltaproteobacteria bacterium]